jgi:hypothetical protein
MSDGFGPPLGGGAFAKWDQVGKAYTIQFLFIEKDVPSPLGTPQDVINGIDQATNTLLKIGVTSFLKSVAPLLKPQSIYRFTYSGNKPSKKGAAAKVIDVQEFKG